MVEQSLLDHNVFAIDIPRLPRNLREIARTVEISLGGISPKTEHSRFSTLPISHYDDQVWAVEAQHLRLEYDDGHWIEQDFVDLTLAGFDATSFFIGLPGTWSETIYASLPHDCGLVW